MAVLTRLIPGPAAVRIGAGAARELPAILADQRISTSGRLAIVISEGSGSELRERLREYLPADAGWFPIRGGTLDDAVDVADRIRASAGSGGGHGLGSYDTIVGLGGGRVIDVTKYAAARLGLPMVAVATNLAHDGICSPVSTLDNDAGRGSYGVPGPIGIVVDLDLVRDAPSAFVRAGIGEALSNLSALADWELSHDVTGEPVDGLAAAMARTAAEAVLHQPGSIEDPAFLAVLAEALVLSGLAMSVAGNSRPSSGPATRSHTRSCCCSRASTASTANRSASARPLRLTCAGMRSGRGSSWMRYGATDWLPFPPIWALMPPRSWKR